MENPKKRKRTIAGQQKLTIGTTMSTLQWYTTYFMFYKPRNKQFFKEIFLQSSYLHFEDYQLQPNYLIFYDWVFFVCISDREI